MEDRSSRWIIEEEDPKVPNPEWFDNAIARAPESRRIVVDDCDIHYLRWGVDTNEKQGVLFVHGAAAQDERLGSQLVRGWPRGRSRTPPPRSGPTGRRGLRHTA